MATLIRKLPFYEKHTPLHVGGQELVILPRQIVDAPRIPAVRDNGYNEDFIIDAPYNTGNEGWVSSDNVNDPHIRKWLGEVVGKRPKTSAATTNCYA